MTRSDRPNSASALGSSPVPYRSTSPHNTSALVTTSANIHNICQLSLSLAKHCHPANLTTQMTCYSSCPCTQCRRNDWYRLQRYLEIALSLNQTSALSTESSSSRPSVTLPSTVETAKVVTRDGEPASVGEVPPTTIDNHR